MIPLDKNPDVRPIGIGDVPRRILAKAILYCISDDITEAAGPLQVCAGQVSGCEAAMHPMKDLFCDDRTEAALLIDASNAFNSVKIWFADDATAVGPVSKLLDWWYHLVSAGLAFRYFLNSSKSFLIVKPEYLSQAESLFGNTNIAVTVQGQRHLGEALGSRAFAEKYVSRKVTNWPWIDKITQLSEIA